MTPAIKRGLLAAALIPSLSFAAVEGEQARLSYSLGVLIGDRILGNYPDLDMGTVIEAIRTARAGDELEIPTDEAMQIIEAWGEAEAARMAEAGKAEGAAYLAEQAQRDGVEKTDSGLLYEVREAGREDGAQPAATDRVTVHYTGKLIDGTVFDSSVERGEPASFGLNQVIPGWTEGLQLMREGAQYTFYIPSELGYGERGAGGSIGPNQTLIFDVELISIDE